MFKIFANKVDLSLASVVDLSLDRSRSIHMPIIRSEIHRSIIESMHVHRSRYLDLIENHDHQTIIAHIIDRNIFNTGN